MGDRRIVDIDHQRPVVQQFQRRPDHAAEFAVGEQHLGFGMLQDEGQRFRIEPDVQLVQHRPGHRHAVMGFQHGGCVGRHDRDRVAIADTARRQRRGQAPAAGIEFAIGPALIAMDHRHPVGMDVGRALQQRERGQRLIIRGGAIQMGVVFRRGALGRHGMVSPDGPENLKARPPARRPRPDCYSSAERIIRRAWRCRPRAGPARGP